MNDTEDKNEQQEYARDLGSCCWSGAVSAPQACPHHPDHRQPSAAAVNALHRRLDVATGWFTREDRIMSILQPHQRERAADQVKKDRETFKNLVVTGPKKKRTDTKP